MSVEVIGLEAVLGSLTAYVVERQKRLHDAADEIARLLESYAKSHHLYRDRTANLTSSTHGGIAAEGDGYATVALYATMSYAPYVELAGPVRGDFAQRVAQQGGGGLLSGGHYAWLVPAVIACEPQMLAILERHLSA